MRGVDEERYGEELRWLARAILTRVASRERLWSTDFVLGSTRASSSVAVLRPRPD